ncbi:MAG: FAD binding domain-containing protein [Spirochaetales bacterium]|nr:FAD binding domain-containing protein [Spirochaetales bacterium]
MRVDEVAAPQSLAEAMAFLKRRSDAVPWAGGTLLLSRNDRRSTDRPMPVLDLGGIPELTSINRSDRYLELGACVTLASILALPSSLSLEPLREAIKLVGTATVRAMATIGGNVAARSAFMTCFAALACMDAAVELRDASGTRWVGIHTLVTDHDTPGFPEAMLLSRVRIPTQPWDAAIVRRLGEPARGETVPASFAATARYEKGTLSELRLVAAGRTIVRDRNLELSLVGKRFPLAAKDVEATRLEASARARDTGFDEARSDRYGAYVAAFLGSGEETI